MPRETVRRVRTLDLKHPGVGGWEPKEEPSAGVTSFYFFQRNEENCSPWLKVVALLSTSWFVPYDMMISGVHTYVGYSFQGQNIDT